MARISLEASSKRPVRFALATTGTCLLTLGLATPAAAQTNSRIEGTVRSPDGEPIASAEVRAESGARVSGRLRLRRAGRARPGLR